MSTPLFTGVGVALVTLFDDDGEPDAARTAKLAAELVGRECRRSSVLDRDCRVLRARVAGLLGVDDRTTKMSYDLGRLRREELIERVPHANTYVLTPAGTRFALFDTKLHDRVVVPLFAADHPPTKPQIRNALATIDHSPKTSSPPPTSPERPQHQQTPHIPNPKDR